MAIQVRRGLEEDLDASKAVSGEFLVSTDSKKVRVCIQPGIVKELASTEDVADAIKNGIESIEEAEENALINISDGVDKTLSVSGKAADAKITGDKVSQLSLEIDEFSEDMYSQIENTKKIVVKQKTSDNLLNFDTAYIGYQLNGVVGEKNQLYPNENRITTNELPCVVNDVFYITMIKTQGEEFLGLDKVNFPIALALDENGTILKRVEWCNPFVVDVAGACFVRFSISKSNAYDDSLATSITKNHYPKSEKTMSNYSDLTVIVNDSVNERIIDMWGDSRTANGWENGTDIATYLNDLLNQNSSAYEYGIQYKAPNYIVNNYGIQAQASGMVSARFGSNEIFIDIENKTIPASGEVNIVNAKCTTGNILNFNCWSTSSDKSMFCSLNGVLGYIIRSQDTFKFIRINEGVETAVRNSTKVIVDNQNSKNHSCIFWVGKNDMGLASGYQVSGVIGNVVGMIDALRHDKFIILGETYDCDLENYGSSTTLRGYVDEINEWYANNYPHNYIDIQAELISKGLEIMGIAPTDADTENIANGFIPDSLMSDATHMNAKGREAIAKIIYAWQQEKGWV